MDLKMNVRKPIFFERNRVWRVYKGGKLFSGFFGDAPEDSLYPEEWVSSDVLALNGENGRPNEGISVVRGTGVLFTDLLREYRGELLGDRAELGILVKLLDSAIRLPVQCHPDRAYSERYLNSTHGKAESWVILETRENACIYFGFRNRITRAEFEKAVAESERNPEAMSSLLNRIPVKKGDVYFIGARMIHAIGAGCLLLETQEPTDFTIQPEYWCGDVKLTPEQMYLGLEPRVALDCFNYAISGEAAIAAGRREPVLVSDNGQVRNEMLIRFSDTPCFAVRRVTLNGGAVTDTEAPAVYVVTNGSGTVSYPNGSAPLRKGDYFFLPHCLKGQFAIESREQMEIIVCIPPEVKK